jgi:cytochrome c-type biogenesis protein CcmH
MKRLAMLLTLLWLLAGPALAVEPSEMLADPALEARAREISKGVRCMVCQNQSIDDSNAGLAADLRVIVRERLAAGDSDEEVERYLVARYGDFVLLKPPMRPSTWLLWFGPVLILLIGGIGVALYLRRRSTAATAAPLSQEEKRRLAALVGESEGETGRR